MYCVTQLNGLPPSPRTFGFCLPGGKHYQMEEPGREVFFNNKGKKKQSLQLSQPMESDSVPHISLWALPMGHKEVQILVIWNIHVWKVCHFAMFSHLQSSYTLVYVSVLLTEIHRWSMCTLSARYSPVWDVYSWCSHNKLPRENFPHLHTGYSMLALFLSS